MKGKRTIRRMNYGQGDLFNFHGAFTEKKDALAKERSTPGAFIKDVWYQGGPRYGVLTRNPKKKLSHTAVKYEHPSRHGAQMCANCIHYIAGKKPACTGVKSPIGPHDWCRRYKRGKRNPFGIMTALDALSDAAAVKSLLGKKKKRASKKPLRKKKKNTEWGTYDKGIFHPWTRRPMSRKKPAKRKLNTNADTAHVQRALHALYPGKSIQSLSMSQLSQVMRAAQDLKAGKPIARRGNPTKRNYADATDLYTQFHGRGPKGVHDTGLAAADFDNHDELGQLGRLVSLTIGQKSWRKKISWGSREAPALASEPGGKQLYLVGGSQNLDEALESLPIRANGSRVTLGECYQLEYFTQKGFDNFQPVTYYHELGEETGERPTVVYDRTKKRIHLVGGAYIVKPEGIVN